MVQVVIVAHSPLASAFKQVAAHAFPEQAQSVVAMDVEPSDSPESIEDRLRPVIANAPETLLMVDVFGASPCNAALRVADGIRVKVLSGVNVPMVWRALSYSEYPLEKLAGFALSGAAQGVMLQAQTSTQEATSQRCL